MFHFPWVVSLPLGRVLTTQYRAEASANNKSVKNKISTNHFNTNPTIIKKMKKSVHIMLIVMMSLFQGWGQSPLTIRFDYDAAGNRVKRYLALNEDNLYVTEQSNLTNAVHTAEVLGREDTTQGKVYLCKVLKTEE